MRRFDCFMFGTEFDILECRLTELQDVPGLTHVIVEADVTHGHNTPKPYLLTEAMEETDRFDRWADRIHIVRATGLPEEHDAWSREHAQREWFREGLTELNAQPDDIVMQSDADEIPTVLAATFVNPRGFVVFEQRLHCFAVDWLHPEPWRGTVAGRYGDIKSFAAMRDARLTAPIVLPEAGWHCSWLGGEEVADRKMRSFCHPEIEPQWTGKLGNCWRTGMHVDGTQQSPVTVDESWPRWIVEGNAPESWYRP